MEDVLKKADEQQIEKQMKEMRLRMVGHLQSMHDNWPQKQLLTFRSKEKEREKARGLKKKCVQQRNVLVSHTVTQSTCFHV